jgi:hypothetical protein
MRGSDAALALPIWNDAPVTGALAQVAQPSASPGTTTEPSKPPKEGATPPVVMVGLSVAVVMAVIAAAALWKRSRESTAPSRRTWSLVAVASGAAGAVAIIMAILPLLGPKKLSREEAQRLVDTQIVDALSAPECHMDVGSKTDVERKHSHIAFNIERCKEPAKAAGLIENAADEVYTYKPKDRIVTVSRAATVTCSKPWICEASVTCGTATLEVDTITTEGRRATIGYTIKREVPDAVVAGVNCRITTTNTFSERKTLNAVLDDEGHWILPK